MRFVSWEDAKSYFKDNNVTVDDVAYFMRMSTATLKKQYDKEVDSDFLQRVNDAIHEAAENKTA